MEERTWTLIVLLFMAPVWLVAMWALLMSLLGGLRDERFTFFRLFTGAFVLEPYNRKYFRIFASCGAILCGVVLLVNVLVFSGTLRMSDNRVWPTPTASTR
ncbi:hypothetical protein [Bradyrhizobium sp. USDA 4353]